MSAHLEKLNQNPHGRLKNVKLPYSGDLQYFIETLTCREFSNFFYIDDSSRQVKQRKTKLSREKS